GLPAYVLDLTRARLPAFGIGLRRVVVMAGLRGPCGIDARIERPVRQVHAPGGFRQRFALQRGGRKPQLAVPRADRVARGALRQLERQHAFRSERGFRFLVGHELRRAAEFAVLRLTLRIDDGDRVAAPALDLALLRLPAAGVVADTSQCGDEIVLDDSTTGIDLGRWFG